MRWDVQFLSSFPPDAEVFCPSRHTHTIVNHRTHIIYVKMGLDRRNDALSINGMLTIALFKSRRTAFLPSYNLPRYLRLLRQLRQWRVR